jgi:hypothetical protein
LGGYFDPNNTPEFAQAKLPVIKLFDFAKGVVRSVMGDPAASGIVQSQELPKTCFYNAPSGGGHCFAYFGQKDQQLYFSDGQSIKYITKPSIPAESALGTLLTLPADLAPKRTIYNFTLMWDEAVGAYTRAYTIENTGKLYCYPLADAGKSSLCNGLPLGPNWPRASIARMSNQLTWKDADTLMISTPSGNVFEVEVN